MKSRFLKSILWALVGVVLHISSTPPRGKASKIDIRPKDDILADIIVQYLTPFRLRLTFLIAIAEILTVQSASFRRITFFPSSCDAEIIGTPFLASFTILSLSFLLRVSCFRALGDMFTFEAVIRPNHKLITSGPYRFVRHPSYTALFGVWIGNILLHSSVCNSWAIKSAFGVWLSIMAVVILKLGLRAKEEDEMLHQMFGAEWESYRLRVPRRFIPGIL